MKRGWFVAGTDTGVGKTRVACGLLQAGAQWSPGGWHEAGGQRMRPG